MINIVRRHTLWGYLFVTCTWECYFYIHVSTKALCYDIKIKHVGPVLSTGMANLAYLEVRVGKDQHSFKEWYQKQFKLYYWVGTNTALRSDTKSSSSCTKRTNKATRNCTKSNINCTFTLDPTCMQPFLWQTRITCFCLFHIFLFFFNFCYPIAH